MMKKLLALLLCLVLLTGCAAADTTPSTQAGHVDSDDNGLCDDCNVNLMVVVDLFGINDLHGKVADGDNHPGVDELTTYIKKAREENDHVIFLSAGDMWQGSSESNLTKGNLTTEWMNDVGFAAMTLGNHEYDWSSAPIADNAELAQFPLLAINVFDRETDQRVSYCEASTVVDLGSIQVGIIGAMGDCYSSIAADKSADVYFKTGDDLTNLVIAESARLRSEGVDLIVYSIHDGYDQSKGGSVTQVSDRVFEGYYDTALSDGYVDIVFEAHTHQRYILQDTAGVYHLQNGGDNEGISTAEAVVNSVTGTVKVRNPKLIATGTYARMDDDPIVEQLLAQYDDQLAIAKKLLGNNGSRRNRNELRQIGADLYYDAGIAKWGVDYDIVLGGGFFSVRDPGFLDPGPVYYSDLYGLFPFDNDLVLCSVKGKDLQEKFFETDNSSYFISYGRYGEQVRQNIDPNETYYIVVDSYTSLYAPNRLTEVARYEPGVYLRDLFAEFVSTGALE